VRPLGMVEEAEAATVVEATEEAASAGSRAAAAMVDSRPAAMAEVGVVGKAQETTEPEIAGFQRDDGNQKMLDRKAARR
jgi:hypothetical protein